MYSYVSRGYEIAGEQDMHRRRRRRRRSDGRKSVPMTESVKRVFLFTS